MKKIIFVTGAHRSGSTWVGKIISSAQHVRYVHEPFNIAMKHPKSPFKYWFEYVDEDMSHQKEVRNFIQSFYSASSSHQLSKFFKISSPKKGYHFLQDLKSRAFDSTLIKDPIGIMSAEWIYKEFNCDMIVTVRHPAAFIASLKVKDWQFDFNHFLSQEKLMERYLSDYREQIEDYAKHKKDIIDQGILLWNIIYKTVLGYEKKYKEEWCFVKHEDLSIDPMVEFGKIFNHLGVQMEENVRELIKDTTTAKQTDDHKRDSKQNIKTWKERLSKEEIERIKSGTSDVWKSYYDETDWS